MQLLAVSKQTLMKVGELFYHYGQFAQPHHFHHQTLLKAKGKNKYHPTARTAAGICSIVNPKERPKQNKAKNKHQSLPFPMSQLLSMTLPSQKE